MRHMLQNKYLNKIIIFNYKVERHLYIPQEKTFLLNFIFIRTSIAHTHLQNPTGLFSSQIIRKLRLANIHLCIYSRIQRKE